MYLEYIPPHLINKANFFNKFLFGKKENQQLASQYIADAKKKQTAIHILRDDNTYYGFVAVSLQCFDKPSKKKFFNIDYLFVSESFRKDKMLIDGFRLPKYFLKIVIDLGIELSQMVPISFIAAEPAVEEVVELYTSVGFDTIDNYDENILYLKL